MNVTLQKHGAKHFYKVPEGLRELCTDISREVLRSQPRNIYNFIAEYIDALLVARENTRAAAKIVNNILLSSQAILSILHRAGLSLEQIATSAPWIQSVKREGHFQKAFRDYLDAVEQETCDEECDCDEESKKSITEILGASGVDFEKANRAATVIQAAFRGHYQRMRLNEAQGRVQWQRALANTLDLLRKIGTPQPEIRKAAKLLQFAYSGYYARRNRKLGKPIDEISDDKDEEDRDKESKDKEKIEIVQAVAWLETIYLDSGLPNEKANEAAIVIQRAFRKYRERKNSIQSQKLEPTKSMVVQGILESLRARIFEKILASENIPGEFGPRERISDDLEKFQQIFKSRLREARLSEEAA